MLRKKILIFGFCILLSSAFFQFLSSILFLNITDSLPLGLYLRIPATEFQKGDYIVYEPSKEVRQMVQSYGWGDGKHIFLKQIGAIAGERYVINEETKEFSIEGNILGRVYDTDTKGHPLPRLRGEYIVPQGHVLPIATNPRSFDGRYTGTISLDMIQAKVMPLFTL